MINKAQFIVHVRRLHKHCDRGGNTANEVLVSNSLTITVFAVKNYNNLSNFINLTTQCGFLVWSCRNSHVVDHVQILLQENSVCLLLKRLFLFQKTPKTFYQRSFSAGVEERKVNT